MSAFKKIAGFVIGVSAVGAIGVAVAQGVPPDPRVSNPALGAGEQTVQGTPIGETGVLAWVPEAMPTAVITQQPQQAAVAPAPEPQPVAQAPAPDTSSQVAQAPVQASPQTMGAGPDTSSPPARARADRG